MRLFMHGSSRIEASGANAPSIAGVGRGNPRGLDRTQDRGLIAGRGGPASGMDCRCPGPEPHELDALDSWREPCWGRNLKGTGPHRTDAANDPRPAAGAGAEPAEVAAGFWAKASAVGRTDA